jgi:hypothetical protein
MIVFAVIYPKKNQAFQTFDALRIHKKLLNINILLYNL